MANPDGTERLCQAVYGHKAEPRDYLGGSEAHMLHDGADLIEALKTRAEQAEAQVRRLTTCHCREGEQTCREEFPSSDWFTDAWCRGCQNAAALDRPVTPDEPLTNERRTGMTKDDIRVGMTFVYDAKQYRVVTPYDDGFMAQVVKSGESRIVMRYFHHNLLPRFEKA